MQQTNMIQVEEQRFDADRMAELNSTVKRENEKDDESNVDNEIIDIQDEFKRGANDNGLQEDAKQNAKDSEMCD